MKEEVSQITEAVRQEGVFLSQVQTEIAKVVVGQESMIQRILMGMLCGGHVLLEGLPGLAKTLTVRSVAEALDIQFNRVQFTPDLLPSDLTGTMIYNQKNGDFNVKKGPIFTNILLADEINRAPAKVQAALLECMAEKQVSIGDTTYKMDEPFLVFATQNPIEQEGTYPLPEAQMDRFMFKVVVGYPTKEEEKIVLQKQVLKSAEKINPCGGIENILKAREVCGRVFMDSKVEDYILEIVFATREPEKRAETKELKGYISIGASPRATIFLAKAAKAKAFLDGRGFCTPDDVKSVAQDILRHRIMMSFEADAEEVDSLQVIRRVLSAVPAP